MASYLILTPPGGPDRDHVRTRFVRDGLSLLAFVFPAFWLLYHRLWAYAITAFLLQAVAGALTDRDGFGPAGFAILFATSLLAGLEGRHAYASNLVARGWRQVGLVSASSLATAEDIYFAETAIDAEPNIPSPEWNILSNQPGPPPRSGTNFGLIGYDGGR